LRSIVSAIVYAKEKYLDRKPTIPEILDLVFGDLQAKGWDVLIEFPQGDLAFFSQF
jgi:hypothetical protein